MTNMRGSTWRPGPQVPPAPASPTLYPASRNTSQPENTRISVLATRIVATVTDGHREARYVRTCPARRLARAPCQWYVGFPARPDRGPRRSGPSWTRPGSRVGPTPTCCVAALAEPEFRTISRMRCTRIVFTLPATLHIKTCLIAPGSVTFGAPSQSRDLDGAPDMGRLSVDRSVDFKAGAQRDWRLRALRSRVHDRLAVQPVHQ